MAKNYARVVAVAACVGYLGVSGCSTAEPEAKKISAVAEPSTVQGSGAGTRDSSRIGSGALKSSRDKSSLEALRRGESAATARDSAMKEVYFDFDRYNLDERDRRILRANAAWLKKNPAARIEIEGHCDDRGTSEYNLALGAKRAQAAKDYLTTLGIAPNRIATTSYGEEIPVCRESNETCWQKNRRDRFVTLTAGPAS